MHPCSPTLKAHRAQPLPDHFDIQRTDVGDLYKADRKHLELPDHCTILARSMHARGTSSWTSLAAAAFEAHRVQWWELAGGLDGAENDLLIIRVLEAAGRCVTLLASVSVLVL